jgi:hypothetical protein
MVKSLIQTENSLPIPSADVIKRAEQAGIDAMDNIPVEEKPRKIKSADMINCWSGGDINLGGTAWFETCIKDNLQLGRRVNLKGQNVNSTSKIGKY